MPKRIQRSRAKGWRMPAGAVYVGRPTKWGNPFPHDQTGRKIAVDVFRRAFRMSQTKLMATMKYADGSPAIAAGLGIVMWRKDVEHNIHELRGKDLACWCPLDQPCHADVLLEMANKPVSDSIPQEDATAGE